jgi:hypothetical protein
LHEHRYRIEADARNSVALPFAANITSKTNQLTIAMHAITTLSGEVFDAETSGPAAGLGIVAPRETVRTDAHGRFTIRRLPAASEVPILLDFPADVGAIIESGDGQQILAALAPGENTIRIVLLPHRRVTVQLEMDEGSVAFSDVQLSVRRGRVTVFSVRKRTDQNGFVDLGPVPLAAGYRVLAWGDEFVGRGLNVPVDVVEQLRANPMVIRCERGVAMRGTVRDKSGNSVAKAWVAARGELHRDEIMVPRYVTTDDAGSFELDHLQPGAEYTFLAMRGYSAQLYREFRGEPGAVSVQIPQGGGTLDLVVTGEAPSE